MAALIGATVAAFASATVVAGLLGTLGFPVPDSGTRLAQVDGLRGYLALSVLAHHFIIWTQVVALTGDWGPSPHAIFNQFGAGAVSLFFMTSGLVFYPRILSGFREMPLISVLVTRFFRILPLLIVSIAFVVMIAMRRSGQLLGRDDLLPLIEWVTAWSQPGLAGNSDAGRINAYVLWSLKCEWFFYLLVLPLCAVLRDVTRGRLPSLVIPCVLLLIAAANRIVHLPLAQYLPLFAAGMVAHEAMARPALSSRLRSPAASLVIAIMLALTTLMFDSPLSPGLPVFAVFFASIACGNGVFGLLTTRGARVLGEVSFGIYLLHGIALSLIFTEGHRLVGAIPSMLTPALLPAIAVILVLVAALTHVGVERPAIRLGSRIARHWSGRGVPPRALQAEIAP